jgi:hypothetical protein
MWKKLYQQERIKMTRREILYISLIRSFASPDPSFGCGKVPASYARINSTGQWSEPWISSWMTTPFTLATIDSETRK